MKFVRKPVEVEAFQYTKQPREEWPQWAQDYRGEDMIGGFAPISPNAVGVLVIPYKASAMSVPPGSWVIMEGHLEVLEGGMPVLRGALGVASNAEFERDFTPATDSEAD